MVIVQKPKDVDYIICANNGDAEIFICPGLDRYYIGATFNENFKDAKPENAALE